MLNLMNIRKGYWITKYKWNIVVIFLLDSIKSRLMAKCYNNEYCYSILFNK